MGEAPTTTAADDEEDKEEDKEEEEKSDDDDDSDDSEEEEEEHRAPIKISNLDDLNAIKRAYEEMFCDGLLHTEKIKKRTRFQTRKSSSGAWRACSRLSRSYTRYI